MKYKDQCYIFPVWNPETDSEELTTRSLESIIVNPTGFRMETIGLLLLNMERKARGLKEYRVNPDTGTYDECT